MKRLIANIVLISFLWLGITAPVGSQVRSPALPRGPYSLSNLVQPVLLKGMIVDPKDPFRLKFIVDKGDRIIDGKTGNDETIRLVKYFLAALTTPEENLWVNLSPFEQDRIVDGFFGRTEMGRDLLMQDYILKQLTAALLHPESNTGKKFWAEVYQRSYETFGTIDIPVEAFTKIWIVPDRARMYSSGNKAYILDCVMKVLLEHDYRADKESSKLTASQEEASAGISDEIFRRVIIPVLTKEINEGTNFIKLRQIYHALVLSAWFKRSLENHLFQATYVDRNKCFGLESSGINKQEIYEQYLDAYRSGAFNFIKEDADINGELLLNNYAAGGVEASAKSLSAALDFRGQVNEIPVDSGQLELDVVDLRPVGRAMEGAGDAARIDKLFELMKPLDGSLRHFNSVVFKEKLLALLSYEGTDQKVVRGYVYDTLKDLDRYLRSDKRKINIRAILGISGHISGIYDTLIHPHDPQRSFDTVLGDIKHGSISLMNVVFKVGDRSKEFDAVSVNPQGDVRSVFEFKFHLTFFKLYSQVISGTARHTNEYFRIEDINVSGPGLKEIRSILRKSAAVKISKGRQLTQQDILRIMNHTLLDPQWYRHMAGDLNDIRQRLSGDGRALLRVAETSPSTLVRTDLIRLNMDLWRVACPAGIKAQENSSMPHLRALVEHPAYQTARDLVYFGENDGESITESIYYFLKEHSEYIPFVRLTNKGLRLKLPLDKVPEFLFSDEVLSRARREFPAVRGNVNWIKTEHDARKLIDRKLAQMRPEEEFHLIVALSNADPVALALIREMVHSDGGIELVGKERPGGIDMNPQVLNIEQFLDGGQAPGMIAGKNDKKLDGRMVYRGSDESFRFTGFIPVVIEVSTVNDVRELFAAPGQPFAN